MAPRIPFPARLAYALTVLLTVWCLGCEAYEPLLAGLIGDRLPMPAQGMMMTERATGALDTAAIGGTESASQLSTAALYGQGERSGLACGCQSCFVSSMPQTVTILSLVPFYPTPGFTPADVITVSHQPLVPPPQLGLARA